MRHNTVQPNVLKSRRLIKKTGEFGIGNSESSHPRVDLEVIIRDLARGLRCPAESIKKIQSKDDGRQSLGNERVFLPLPEATQRENGAGDAGGSYRKSLLGQCYSEPRHSGLFKRARTLHSSMPIGVGFDRSHY